MPVSAFIECVLPLPRDAVPRVAAFEQSTWEPPLWVGSGDSAWGRVARENGVTLCLPETGESARGQGVADAPQHFQSRTAWFWRLHASSARRCQTTFANDGSVSHTLVLSMIRPPDGLEDGWDSHVATSRAGLSAARNQP